MSGERYITVEGMRFHLGSLVYDKSVAIFNMGTAGDCPSDAANLCLNRSICYAKKSERAWPVVSRMRRKQGRTWRKISADQMTTAMVWLHKRYAVDFLRFNEASDLWSQKDVDKLNIIADNSPVSVFGYTANPYLNYTNAAFNIKISHWFKKEGTTGRAVVIPKGSKPPSKFILCLKTTKRIKRCTDGCGICFTDHHVDVCFYQH